MILEFKLMEILECVVMLKGWRSCVCFSILINFLIGGFIYYKEGSVVNFWDKFNVLEYGSIDFLIIVFRFGVYLGKKFLIISIFI